MFAQIDQSKLTMWIRIGATLPPYMNGILWMILSLNETFRSINRICGMVLAFSQIFVAGVYMILLCNVSTLHIDTTAQPLTHWPIAILGAFITGILLERVPLYITLTTCIVYVICTMVLYCSFNSEEETSSSQHSTDQTPTQESAVSKDNTGSTNV